MLNLVTKSIQLGFKNVQFDVKIVYKEFYYSGFEHNVFDGFLEIDY